MARLRLVIVVVFLLMAAGCDSSGALPKTYPVRGSVAYKGGQPMKGGSVQFTSATDPTLRVIGSIHDDGTFTLETLRDKKKAAGAPEGEYQVLILPPLQGDHKGVPPIVLPKLYTIKPQENQFNIELTISPPRS